jgi:hypothetical protein
MPIARFYVHVDDMFPFHYRLEGVKQYLEIFNIQGRNIFIYVKYKFGFVCVDVDLESKFGTSKGEGPLDFK